MNTLTYLTPVRRAWDKPKAIALPINAIDQFTFLIEKTKWDDELIKSEACTKRFCLAIIVAASLFFLPAILAIFFR